MQEILRIIEGQGMKLLGGIIVLSVGFFLIHWILKYLNRDDRFLRIDPMLKGFLINLIRVVLYIVVVLTAASVMGIPLASFVTVLASAGVAVSLALQGALGNFVGGLTILVLKLFSSGDYVKIGDIEGSVRAIGLFYTELTTPDGRRVSLPNSSLTNTPIVNFTREGTRRVDVSLGVSYDADLDRVLDTLRSVAAGTPGVLPDPAPIVKLTDCGDSSLTFTIRAWCRSADFLNVGWDLLENGKRALDRAGIEIPYPQLDVHIRSQS